MKHILVLMVMIPLMGCATVKDNPPPPYPELSQSLHSFVTNPQPGQYSVPPGHVRGGATPMHYALIVTNSTVLLQPWPPRIIDCTFELYYPPLLYRPQILTQDALTRLLSCKTREEVIAIIGSPNEEEAEFTHLLPPVAGKPLGLPSRSSRIMHYQWFTVTESDHLIETYIGVELRKRDKVWCVDNIRWRMEGPW